MQNNKTYYYGGHMSIKNGIISAIINMNKIGGNMIQVFISNPMSIKFSIDNTKFNDKICKQIQTTLLNTDSKIVIHLPYVINLAKPLLSIIGNCWWIKMICNQLLISESIGSIGCVVHVGKYIELTPDEGINNMYNGLKYVIEFIKINELKTHIILETAAGQGTELITTKNNSLEEFANFYNRFDIHDKLHIRICIDTCHIFAAGYDIRLKSQVKTFFNEFHNLIGIQYIDLIHLNDSKTICGSCVDRHECLGQGKIGLKGLKHIIRYSIYNQIPIILETPSDYIYELELINKLKNQIG